jgi:hypothetical protein
MQKWEYKTEVAPRNDSDLVRLLTKLGEEGWESAFTVMRPASGQGTDYYTGAHDVIVFKRPKFG